MTYYDRGKAMQEQREKEAFEKLTDFLQNKQKIEMTENELYEAYYHMMTIKVRLDYCENRINEYQKFLGILQGFLPWHSKEYEDKLRK